MEQENIDRFTAGLDICDRSEAEPPLQCDAHCSNITTLSEGGCNMSVLTMTSREFNQSASEAKKASLSGPVFITDRGRPSHVLLSIDEYRKLAGGMTTLAEALAQDSDVDVEFEAPRLGGLYREADLS
jgi:prevent-host-death family protein